MVRNNESLSPIEIRDIKEGRYRLIYGHPEAFVGKPKRIFGCKTVNERVQAVVIDEAHLIVDWKHFRPAYAQLCVLVAVFSSIPIISLTATATVKTRNKLSRSLGMVEPVTIAVNPNRDNIYYSVSRRPHHGDDKIKELLQPYMTRLFQEREKMPLDLTLFYSNLAICGECFSIFGNFFQEKQYHPIGAPKTIKNRRFAQYHANYPEKEKSDILHDLLHGPGVIRVLFVTVAFGIDIDCPNVRDVVHIGVPRTMEEYFQECGRAGRDGKPATSTIYFSSYDISYGLENMQPVMRQLSGHNRRIYRDLERF